MTKSIRLRAEWKFSSRKCRLMHSMTQELILNAPVVAAYHPRQRISIFWSKSSRLLPICSRRNSIPLAKTLMKKLREVLILISLWNIPLLRKKPKVYVLWWRMNSSFKSNTLSIWAFFMKNYRTSRKKLFSHKSSTIRVLIRSRSRKLISKLPRWIKIAWSHRSLAVMSLTEISKVTINHLK